jgi:hypothetical protein
LLISIILKRVGLKNHHPKSVSTSLEKSVSR